MNCAQTKNLMKEFLNGGLSGAEARSVRAHLSSCSHCASALGEIDRIEVLTAMDEEIEPSRDFHARFMSRLETQRATQVSRPQSSASWWSLFLNWNLGRQLAVVGALAAVLFIGVYVGKYRTTESVPAPGTIGDIAIAENLPLLRDMRVIENLDLLEDFDAIQNLEASNPPASTVQ